MSFTVKTNEGITTVNLEITGYGNINIRYSANGNYVATVALKHNSMCRMIRCVSEQQRFSVKIFKQNTLNIDKLCEYLAANIPSIENLDETRDVMGRIIMDLYRTIDDTGFVQERLDMVGMQVVVKSARTSVGVRL